MNTSQLRQIIREEILKELETDSVIDNLSIISLSLTDIQKQLVSSNPELANKLQIAQQIIQDVQNALA
jgi:hypothetical protein